MKNLVVRTILFLLCLISIFCILNAKSALAATQPNSISVTPSIAHIDLATDAPQYNITYENSTKYAVTLSLSVQDFTELEQGYKLSFLNGVDAKNYKYSLSSWISFENPQVELNPGEKKTIKIFIDKNEITKGGHYASILAEISQPEQKKQVNVKGVLSSLLFVRASTGKEIEEGKINSFVAVRDWLESPKSFVLSFENSGNVFLTPYGVVEIFDPLGNLAGKGILNSDSSDVLPESIRRFDIPVSQNSKILLPGFYKARISMHFGKSNTKLSQELTFLSLGSFDIAKIVILLVIIAVLTVYFRRKRKKSS